MTSNGKIGMMTFHASHNNGSMLQALALQHVLEDRFHQQTELIDFSNRGQRNMYAPIPKPKNWKQAIKSFIWATNMKERCRSRTFISQVSFVTSWDVRCPSRSVTLPIRWN